MRSLDPRARGQYYKYGPARMVFDSLKRCSKPLFLIIIVIILLWYFCTPRSITKTDVQTNERPPEQQEKFPAKEQYPNYYEDDLHSTWNFKISKNYDQQFLHNWTEPVRMNRSEIWTQGENGQGFVPSNEEEKTEMEKLKGEHKYNIFASERMPLHRSLRDYRTDDCRQLSYPKQLPETSVIIIFHNEVWTALLRTVWSVIDRSPSELLHEIILVDDASTWPALKRPLDDYIELLPANVRIIRTAQREGLIRARLIGAKNATGSILTFLDGHMECTDGWLQPIVARIASDRSVVAVPFIVSISSTDMKFYLQSPYINGLYWYLLFDWRSIPPRELLRTNNDKTAPLRTPTHVGCAFSIDREFFFEIGSYDEAMDIWSGENVEMAFRVWMCGGSLEIFPCSIVGHMYRVSTYSFEGDQQKIISRNNVRLVEVWMDDFKYLYYAQFPDRQFISVGDLTERKELRKNLKCKSFRWYLENIFPESYWLKEYVMVGEFQNVAKGTCLDINSGDVDRKLIAYYCHGGGGNQFFALTKSGQMINSGELCVGINNENIVVIVKCSDEDKSQLWIGVLHNDKHWIAHRASGLCMRTDETDIKLDKCDEKDKRFQWNFKSNVPKGILVD